MGNGLVLYQGALLHEQFVALVTLEPLESICLCHSSCIDPEERTYVCASVVLQGSGSGQNLFTFLARKCL